MGTNPSYIGRDADGNIQRVDRISGRIGYKVINFVYDKYTDVRVQPPHYRDITFGLSDDSRCDQGRKHQDLIHCSCGFYAYNTVEAAVQHWTNACAKQSNEIIVEVALSGEVVVAEKGYRATHQRITRMYLPHCFKCANRAEVLAFHKNGVLVPACTKCVTKNNPQLSFKEFATQFSPEGFAPIEIIPSGNLSRDIDLFKSDMALFQEAQLVIDKIAAAGKVKALEQIMTYTTEKLDASFGFGE